MRALLVCLCLILTSAPALAGPFPPPVGQNGTDAVAAADPAILGWAVGVADYQPGTELDGVWQETEEALGQAEGDPSAILGLGRGGSVILTMDPPLADGPGPDLAVYENSFDDRFLELAFVAVSSDGETFCPFSAVSLTATPIPGYGGLDVTDVSGLAGRYIAGYGTPFDLNDLRGAPEVLAGEVDLSNIRYVRLTDVVGDGTALDLRGRPIYDPYPTTGSAGFDLDGLAALNQAREESGAAPVLTLLSQQPPSLGPASGISPFRIEILDQADGTPVFAAEMLDGTALTPPPMSLLNGRTYVARLRTYNATGAPSPLSEPLILMGGFPFTDENGDTVADGVQLDPAALAALDLNANGISDAEEQSPSYRCINLGQFPTCLELAGGEFRMLAADPMAPTPTFIARIGLAETGGEATLNYYTRQPEATGVTGSNALGERASLTYLGLAPEGEHELVRELLLRDAGAADADGVANGLVLIWAGPGTGEESVVEGEPGDGGIGGSGGCVAQAGGQNGGAPLLLLLPLLALACLLRRGRG